MRDHSNASPQSLLNKIGWFKYKHTCSVVFLKPGLCNCRVQRTYQISKIYINWSSAKKILDINLLL